MTQDEQDAFLAANFPKYIPDHLLTYDTLVALMAKVGAQDVTEQYPGYAVYVIQDFWDVLQCFDSLPQARRILTEQLMLLSSG